MIYKLKSLTDHLFFDIETVAGTKNLNELSENRKRIWYYRYHNKFKAKAIEEQMKYLSAGMDWKLNIEDDNDIYLKYAPLVAEFSKVIAISFGLIEIDERTKVVRKDFETICVDDELLLLTKAGKVFESMSGRLMSGYNIVNFDIPVLCKRFLINGLNIPNAINFLGKKPWEITVSDLSKDWNFGGYEMVAFESVSEALGLGTSKTGDVNGMDLSWMYYNGYATLKQIATYCEADVNANIDACLKLSK